MSETPHDELENGPDPWRVMMARELADKFDAALAEMQAAVDGKAEVMGQASVADFIEPCLRAVTYTLSRYVSAVTLSRVGRDLDNFTDEQVGEMQQAFHREVAVDLQRLLQGWIDTMHARLVRLRKSGLFSRDQPG